MTKPPVFFPPSPPSPSMPCAAILTENCSLKDICSPLSFPSVWSPYSELQGSFPDESETFNCSIHLNLGSQSIRDENDYDAQSIWDEKITSLSNIAVTDDFSLRWHSCNQTRIRKFHAIKAGWEIRSNQFHTRTFFSPPWNQDKLRFDTYNTFWNEISYWWYTLLQNKRTLRLSLSSRREVLPLLQPTVTRHPFKGGNISWCFKQGTFNFS